MAFSQSYVAIGQLVFAMGRSDSAASRAAVQHLLGLAQNALSNGKAPPSESWTGPL
jgi:hypothetical protein